MRRGVFISFEGGEGAGKTTQIGILADRLRSMGIGVVATREPGGTVLGAGIRKHLVSVGEDPPSPRAELLLYGADRAHHVERVIIPALKRGEAVLCDRYADATVAYQGWGRGLDGELIAMINRAATGGLMPDRTLWIDIDPGCGVERSLRRQAAPGEISESRFEEELDEFHRRVREGYEAIAEMEPGRVRRIDGAGTEAEVAAQIWREVGELFGEEGP